MVVERIWPQGLTSHNVFARRFQVEYALEAVRKGALAVGVRGTDTIVLGECAAICGKGLTSVLPCGAARGSARWGSKGLASWLGTTG